ncbi:MAG: hypothetical protein R3346_02025 [Candidatus Spechtbacterales bacterium]|nr:hypothetical protein [Candidatus Spechtbacterales bacterium]
MSIEKPRLNKEEALKEGRAVQMMAEEMANLDYLDNPGYRYYEQAHQILEDLKSDAPELAKYAVENALSIYELRNRAGKEAWRVYKQAENRIQDKVSEDLRNIIKPLITRIENMDPEAMEDDDEYKALMKEIRSIIINELEGMVVRSVIATLEDEEVVKAFDGKEDVLEDIKAFATTEMLSSAKNMLESLWDMMD